MNPNLSNYIQRYIDITDKELEVFEKYLSLRKVRRKEFILEEGQICTSRYYIKKGCVRLFYIDQKGNEQIIHFGIDDWWITDYDSLISQVPSKIYIQAIEDTEILVLNESEFEALCQVLPKTERLFRMIMERTYIAAQRRIEFMFSLSGKELYDTFIAANPGFVQRVPQYMIASYLGMTPEFISKIRGQKN